MKVVRLSPLHTGRLYSFLEAESTPGHMQLSDAPEKNHQQPGIDPGTLRLVAQCLNHYTNPGPMPPDETGHMELSDAPEKNPQRPGIDPGTLRPAAQCLNHYTTAGPIARPQIALALPHRAASMLHQSPLTLRHVIKAHYLVISTALRLGSTKHHCCHRPWP
jgi:hypothetical protein